MRVHRQKLDCRHAQLLQIFDRSRAADTSVSAAEFLRHIRPQLRETFHVHFIDHRAMQRNSGPLVIAPIKRIIDHHRFRHSPRVIAKIARQIFQLVTDDVGKHFVGPIDFAGDRFGIRIEQQLGTVEAHPLLGIVRTVDAVTVKLSRFYIRQENVPDLIGVFGHRDPHVFLRRIHVVEETKINRRGCLGKYGEVDAIPQPGGAERIRITKPNFYRGHNCNPFLSNTDYALAITKTVEYWSTGAMA